MTKTTRRLSPAMDRFLYAKDEKIHTEAETALPTRRRRRSISPMPTDLNTTALWPDGQVEIKDCRVTYSVSSSELLLAINDIHLRALAARHGGDDGSIMLEIEQIAEDIIDRACNEGEGDTEFTTDE